MKLLVAGGVLVCVSIAVCCGGGWWLLHYPFGSESKADVSAAREFRLAPLRQIAADPARSDADAILAIAEKTFEEHGLEPGSFRAISAPNGELDVSFVVRGFDLASTKSGRFQSSPERRTRGHEQFQLAHFLHDAGYFVAAARGRRMNSATLSLQVRAFGPSGSAEWIEAFRFRVEATDYPRFVEVTQNSPIFLALQGRDLLASIWTVELDDFDKFTVKDR